MTFVGDFVRYLKTRTDAPPDFHYHAALVALSTALGTRVWAHGWTRPLYPNLWVVVIAPSGYGKSAPLDMCERIIRKAQLQDRLLPGSFSYEALLQTLKTQPVGTFVTQEFANFVAMMGRDYNSGCRELLAEIYDCPESVRRVTMRGDVTIDNPCLSILGASSPTWFADSLKGKPVEGGFLERIVFCPSTKTGPTIDDPGPPNEGVETVLADHLRRVMRLHGCADFSQVQATFSAWQRKSRDELRAAGAQEFGGMRSRAPLLVKKAAILFHVSRDPTNLVITESDLKYATDYVEHSHALALDFLMNEVAQTADEGDRIKLVDILRRHDGKLDWSSLLRLSRMNAVKFKLAIETLQQSGRVEVKTARGENGRDQRWVVLTPAVRVVA